MTALDTNTQMVHLDTQLVECLPRIHQVLVLCPAPHNCMWYTSVISALGSTGKDQKPKLYLSYFRSSRPVWETQDAKEKCFLNLPNMLYNASVFVHEANN